jgi:hypothetical protein
MDDASLVIKPVEMPRPSTVKPWLVGGAAALAILLTAVFVMDRTGLFEPETNAPGAQRIAAALALVGAVLSAAVTLVGTVVKFAIDDRTARQAAIESDRNYRLAIEEGRRNRIELVIRAVDLLSENNANATKTQIGGAVLALVNLGEHAMAVSLLGQLWPADLATRQLAEMVVDEVFRTGSEDAQKHAAAVLYENAAKLADRETYYWPIPNLGWRADLPEDTRLTLAVAAIRWMMSDLQSDRHTFPLAAVILRKCLDDESRMVREFSGAVLRPFVRFYAEMNLTNELLPDLADAFTAAETEKRITDPPPYVVALSYASSVSRLLEAPAERGAVPPPATEAPLPSKPETQPAPAEPA